LRQGAQRHAGKDCKSLKYKLLKAFRKKGELLPLTYNDDISFEWSHESLLVAQ
jgi:hypothetical protein